MASTQIGQLTESSQSFSTFSVKCSPPTRLRVTKDTDSTQPLLCKNAILKLPYNKKITKYLMENNIDLNVPFVKFLKDEAYEMKHVQKIAKIKLIILKKLKNNFYCLIYDGRFFDLESYKTKIWVFNSKGHFINQFKKLKSTLKLRPNKKEKKCQPLWQLLALNEKKPDPQTPQELKKFLCECNKTHQTIVNFIFKPFRYIDLWSESPSYKNVPTIIEAFTNSKFLISYKLKKIAKRKEDKKLMQDNTSAPLTLPLPTQQNKSSSVNVKMAGLNEAFNLGIITLENLAYFSQELSKTVGVLQLELDDSDTARFATYKDATKLFQIEIKKECHWTKLFDVIVAQKKIMTEKKKYILKSIFNKLMALKTDLNSPYNKCLRSLENCIKTFKIIVYDQTDFLLHALKLHLAHYLNTHQKRYFLSLNTNDMNDLTCIRNSEICIFNLYSYLEDEDFFQNNLPAATIKSSVTDFNHHENPAINLTMLQYCKNRGKSIAENVHILYQTFVFDFIQIFTFDICSLPYLSLASLSFQVVWTKYTRMGGHFHQGLEKIKPHYENILRNFCQGGYYYSCKDTVDAGRPIHNTHGNCAATVFHHDIISSYGASCSQISTPSGFCYGYVFDEEEKKLMRCDKLLRHTTFEFLCVFYTIDNLTDRGYNIKTCYSNFHQTGIFCVGHYPLDLVVVCQDGKIFLFQFDGQVSIIFLLS
jgi:hypothetical protein